MSWRKIMERFGMCFTTNTTRTYGWISNVDCRCDCGSRLAYCSWSDLVLCLQTQNGDFSASWCLTNGTVEKASRHLQQGYCSFTLPVHSLKVRITWFMHRFCFRKKYNKTKRSTICLGWNCMLHRPGLWTSSWLEGRWWESLGCLLWDRQLWWKPSRTLALFGVWYSEIQWISSLQVCKKKWECVVHMVLLYFLHFISSKQ